MMKLTDSDLALPLSTSPDLSVHAGPSSLASGLSDDFVVTNGHTNGFKSMTNGKSETGSAFTNGVQKHSPSVTRVTLPGTALYDDSPVNREEFVRLVIQSLRDVGYVSVLLSYCCSESRLISPLKAIGYNAGRGIWIHDGISGSVAI